MKKFLIYLSSFLILFGVSVVFAGVYTEDFEDGVLDSDWSTSGDYVIAGGNLYMYHGVDLGGGIMYSDVGLKLLDEFVYHFEADIYAYSSNVEHDVASCIQWKETSGQTWEANISLNPPILQATLKKDSTNISQQSLGLGNYNEFYTLGVTINEDFVTISINGIETDLFRGLFQKPDSFLRSYGYVKGSVHPPYDVDYYTDNLVAYTSNLAKFDYVNLGSEVRQYDPSRYSFDKNSIWYNGNPYWFMSAFAGTSGDPPIYPVFLDAPIYSDPSNREPYGLNDIPNYVTNTNFSAAVLYPVSGFDPPGPAWENKTYTFFIDANANGLLDSRETTEDWPIPPNSIRKMGIPRNINISGGIHPTISWDSVPNADVYMVNFYSILESSFPDFDVRLHTSGQITATSYTYTGDLFSDGKEYAIWVQAREFHPDFSIDPETYRGLFINRSGYFTTYKAGLLDSMKAMPWIPLLLLDD